MVYKPTYNWGHHPVSHDVMVIHDLDHLGRTSIFLSETSIWQIGDYISDSVLYPFW